MMAGGMSIRTKGQGAPMAKRKIKHETWEEYRRRMLDETARFIEWGLRHPDLVIEIPAKPVGEGGFPRQVANWFWTTVLTPNPDSRIRRWRDFLLRRPKDLFRLYRRSG
jgi:hypothetical protein